MLGPMTYGIAAALQGGAAAPSPLLTDLVAYYKFDEVSPGIAAVTRVDSHGSFDLTDVNNMSSADGLIGKALAPTGAAKSLSRTDAGLETGGGAFFFSIWLNPHADAAGNLSWPAGLWGGRGWLIQKMTDSTIRFTIKNAAAVQTQPTTTATMTAGAWHWVAVWYDGTTAHVQLDDTTPVSLAHASGADDGGLTFNVGVPAQNDFKGLIDEAYYRIGSVPDSDERALLRGGGSPPEYPFDGSSLPEPTLSDNFDDNELADKWIQTINPAGQGGGSISEQNQRLEMALISPAGFDHVYVNSYLSYRVSGDFDIQADFEVTMLDEARPWAVLQAGDTSGSGVPSQEVRTVIKYQNNQRQYGGEIRTNSLPNPLDGTGGYANTSDTSGKMRITRVGTTATAYYWDNVGEEWVALETGTIGEDDLGLRLWIASDGPDITMYWDNLVVVADGIVSV